MFFAKWVAVRRDVVDDRPTMDSVVRSLITDIRYEAEAQGAAIGGNFNLAVNDLIGDFFIRNMVTVLAESPIIYRFTPLGEQFGRAGKPFWRPRGFWGS